MLDFNNLDFSNICENWFLNFNDFLKDDKFNYDNLFYSESHWRDFVSITGDIITFTGIKNFNDILQYIIEIFNSCESNNVSSY